MSVVASSVFIALVVASASASAKGTESSAPTGEPPASEESAAPAEPAAAEESAPVVISGSQRDSESEYAQYSAAAESNGDDADSGGFWPPSRILGYAVFGFAGNANYDIVNSDADELFDFPTFDIATSLGGGLRFDWFDDDTPIVGMNLGLGAFQWKPDTGFDKASTFVHLTVQVRLRKAFANDQFEIYLGLPIDLGINIVPDVENGLGWGVGLGGVGGIVAMFPPNIGVFAEGGINYHFIFQDATPDNRKDDLQARVIVRRVVLLTGLAVSF